jgi:hypothetical protein
MVLAGMMEGATYRPTTSYQPRPFPRRLSALEKSDTALGGDLVNRVSQTTPGSQGRAILEDAINRTPPGEALSVGRSSGSFPTFTKRGGDRAQQMAGRYKTQSVRRPMSESMARNTDPRGSSTEAGYQEWLRSRGQ